MYYSDFNGLANFWERDMARVEWAKWVYHHPEQTRRLLEILLRRQQYQKSLLEQVVARLDANDVTDAHQEESITNIINNATYGDNAEAIPLEDLIKLLEEE